MFSIALISDATCSSHPLIFASQVASLLVNVPSWFVKVSSLLINMPSLLVNLAFLLVEVPPLTLQTPWWSVKSANLLVVQGVKFRLTPTRTRKTEFYKSEIGGG